MHTTATAKIWKEGRERERQESAEEKAEEVNRMVIVDNQQGDVIAILGEDYFKKTLLSLTLV